MKLELLVAVPPDVVTLIGPVAANVGTVAVSDVDDSTLKWLALIPLNFTAVAPVKFVPVTVTPVPTGPVVGAKAVMVGAGVPVLNSVTRLSEGRPTTNWSLTLSNAKVRLTPPLAAVPRTLLSLVTAPVQPAVPPHHAHPPSPPG